MFVLTDLEKHLFNAFPLGVYFYQLEDRDDDRSLRMIYANPASQTLTGIAAETVIGNTIDECFPNLREKGIPQLYAQVVRDGAGQILEDVYYKDERVVQGAFWVAAIPVMQDHVCILFDNVTERKQREVETLLLCKQRSVGKLAAGLAIVHSVIVDRHKGAISLQENPESGAVFCIRLPLTCKQPQ